MKHRGIILIVLLAIAVIAIIFLPKERSFKEVAVVGSPAPEFELKDINGNLWRLSELKGKVVFMNFWATWCSVCKTETPFKEALLRQMKGKPFQMLGIIYRDNLQDVKAYVEKYGVTVPTLISPDDEIARLHGIAVIPQTFIIDKDGVIRERILGLRQWDSPESIALIEKWL